MSRTADPVSQSEAGFSLLELLVVLAIISLVLATAVQAPHRRTDDARLRAAQHTLAADLRLARQRAMASGQELNVVFDPARSRYANLVGTFARELPATVQLGFEPVTSRRTDSEAPAIRFYPDGTSSGGRVRLVAGSRAYTVSVSWPFGHIETGG